jgi:hypothetical protein
MATIFVIKIADCLSTFHHVLTGTTKLTSLGSTDVAQCRKAIIHRARWVGFASFVDCWQRAPAAIVSYGANRSPWNEPQSDEVNLPSKEWTAPQAPATGQEFSSVEYDAKEASASTSTSLMIVKGAGLLCCLPLVECGP